MAPPIPPGSSFRPDSAIPVIKAICAARGFSPDRVSDTETTVAAFDISAADDDPDAAGADDEHID